MFRNPNYNEIKKCNYCKKRVFSSDETQIKIDGKWLSLCGDCYIKYKKGNQMIISFLKDSLREINEEKTSKENFDFLELTFFEFIELRNKIEVKYNVMIKCVDIFKNNGIVELARRIETLVAIKEVNEDRE